MCCVGAGVYNASIYVNYIFLQKKGIILVRENGGIAD